MTNWAHRITVPVFISGALQDEQTGPQWPALLTALPGTTPVFANMVNGGHIDSTDPQIISRWLEFLDLYVADKVPTNPVGLGGLILDQFTSFAAGTSAQAPLPAIRFRRATTVAQARLGFAHNTPRIRVLFDSGAGPVGAGDPQSTYSAGFNQWPPPGGSTTYWFGSGGSLTTGAQPPTTSGSASLLLDPGARPATSLPPGGNAWAASPGWNWTPVPAADGVAFQTAPLASDTTVVGPATLDLRVTSASPVVDLQATITEVRPGSGQEEYVTSGFLRSSNQVDLPLSTDLFTVPSFLGGDAKTLSATATTLVKVPIDPVVHTFRAGTELRVVLSAPGGDRPSWEFATVGRRKPDGLHRVRQRGRLVAGGQGGSPGDGTAGPADLRLAPRRAVPRLPGGGQPGLTGSSPRGDRGQRSAAMRSSAASASAISRPTSSPAGTSSSMAPTP